MKDLAGNDYHEKRWTVVGAVYSDSNLLLLAESQGFLHGNRHLMLKSIMRLIWRKIQSVEAIEIMLANVQHKTQAERKKKNTRYATWAMHQDLPTFQS